MAFLEIQNAGKIFTSSGGKTYEALRGVNLEINEGEFIAIIGHSGCGKSTVLNMVAGLSPATAGRVVVDGQIVREPGPDRMVAFQNHSLLPWLTVRQNIALAVNSVYTDRSEGERAALVEEHITLVNLQAAADKKPGEISGGMRQRVGIARALATRPKVLLLDEPFGALDALTRGRLQEQLLQIWEAHRITVVMITHDVDEALLLSDRIVMMSNGPAAKVAEIMTVELPRPRKRIEVINDPNYYRQRNELLYYLNKAKKAKSSAPLPVASKATITLGFVPLTDCAPLVIAQEKGFFAKYGLNVTLSRESSWKTALQGVLEDRLQASQMVAGMPLMETLHKNPLVTALTLSRGGNAITLSKRFYDLGIHTAQDLKRYLDQDTSGKQHTLGMVHPASMHNLLLRHWLASAGINPDRDLKLVAVPPPQMVANLQSGNIDGYCVGEPWNARAVHEGLGFVPATSLDLWAGHPEKVLGLKESWAQANPDQHLALIKALLEACAFCNAPEHRAEVTRLVLQKQYVNADASYGAMGLSGHYDYGTGKTAPVPDFIQFGGALGSRSERLWILTQLARWGLVPFPENWPDLLDRVYLEDAFQTACTQLELSFPTPEETLPPDLMLDPRDPLAYLRALAIKQELKTTALKFPSRLLHSA